MALGEFTISEIQHAFVAYMQENPDFPAPADIVAIIRNNPKPMDRDVYRSLTKKEAMLRTDAEWDYIRRYERLHLEK